MMNSKAAQRFFITTLCLICCVFLWIFRYNSINHFYKSNTIRTEAFYPMCQEIEFGDEYLALNESAEGHSICVNKVEFVDFYDYTSCIGNSADTRKAKEPEKLVLVYITLRNKDGNISDIFLPNFSLYGVDSNPQLDYELLTQINPILQTASWYVSLQQGAECDLILPYMLFEQDYKRSTWENLESQTFYFQITAFPTAKFIKTDK